MEMIKINSKRPTSTKPTTILDKKYETMVSNTGKQCRTGIPEGTIQIRTLAFWTEPFPVAWGWEWMAKQNMVV